MGIGDDRGSTVDVAQNEIGSLAANAGQLQQVGHVVGHPTTFRFQQLQKLMVENKKIIDSVQPVLASFAQKLSQGVKLKPDQVKYFQELLNTHKTKQQEQEDYMKEMQSLQAIIDESANARVEVTGEVFGGTRICIADVSMVVKNSMNYCKFIKSQGDVKMMAL